MNAISRNLRQAARRLWRSPAFTAVSVLALAVGIGANTTVFSLVNASIIRPLPFGDPSELAIIYSSNPDASRVRSGASYDDLIDWREQSTRFQAMAGYRYWGNNFRGEQEPLSLTTIRCTPNLMRLLGVNPMLGRSFLDEEAVEGAHRVTVLTHRFWLQQFGGDESIIGRSILLDGEPYEVVGVMGPEFLWPDDERVSAYLPFVQLPFEIRRDTRALGVVGRLAPGATIEQADAEMKGIAARLESERGDTNEGWTAGVESLDAILFQSSMPLLLVWGPIVFVLLIACVNVATLQLARMARRHKETVLRAALGASRRQVMGEFLAESFLLAGAGGMAGLLIAAWGVDLVLALNPGFLPGWNAITIDMTVLGFTVLASGVAALVSGILPAIQVSNPDITSALGSGAGRSTLGPGYLRAMNGLVVAEIAMAVLLVVGAGLLINSFVRVQSVDPGFDSENVLTAWVDVPWDDGERSIAFYEAIVDRISEHPEVEHVGLVTALPMNPGIDYSLPVTVPQRADEDQVNERASFRVASPDYFAALRVPLLQGRAFTRRDRSGAPQVMIVNQRFADIYFNGENPVGRRVQIPQGDDMNYEIVGLVGNVKNRDLTADFKPEMWIPMAQSPFGFVTIVARTRSRPEALIPDLKNAVYAVDSNQPLSNIATFDSLIGNSVARSRFLTILMSVFAGIGLLLAMIGVNALFSFSVAQRTQEIGVRVALGAMQGDVVRNVVLRGARLAAIGVTIGVVAGLALSRFLSSLLFDLSPVDPATYGGVAVLMLLVAIAATYFPARRASRIQPMEALRYE